MDDNFGPKGLEATRPRRASVAAEPGANVSREDDGVTEVCSARETPAGPGRLKAAFGRMEGRNSALQASHQRHMPMDVLKMPIPRKNKEKRALFQDVTTESREYDDMMTILTSSYIDTGSAGCFTYSKPQLIHSELLEKEFVEKRREMKSEGRTDKELEESYCFLLTDSHKLAELCQKGVFVGQSRITILGNPNKGVYLSRYSDLLQVDPITPGATGEIIIFKVMKGKVKSIYENMKNLLDPTPRFDSHIAKNASKVTSLTSYRAFDLTQHYFYEYAFDELRPRPRQVCPYAVVSFQFKGKDSALPSAPLAPVRLNSQSAEGTKERAQFTVWTGDLVKGDRVLFQISLRSFSPPFLPHRLPDKLEIGSVMRLEQVTKLLPSDLLSYKLYGSSPEVVKNGHYCSLLEVTDRNRSATSVKKLLQELEMKRVVLVTPLTDRGFLFLLSSVQMTTPAERGENWKRSLQALFVFPESRDVSKSTVRPASSSRHASETLPWLKRFIPALHHALVKTRANPPPELSAGVERQSRDYLIGLKEGKVRQYLMGDFESKPNERGNVFHHKLHMDAYLRSYFYSPALYLLSAASARQLVEKHCGPEEPQEVRLRSSYGGQREATRNTIDGQTNTQKMQQLVDLVLTCKRNAENEVSREAAGRGEVTVAPGRKRRLEQETAERALKFLKASQEPRKHGKIPVEERQVPACSGSLASVIGSVGLKDVDLSEDGSELAAKLYSLLTGLNQAARGPSSESQEEAQRESCPFGRLATKLGLPTNCDIDLRRQEELEEQTVGSVSSLEGFSPSSHSGETNHHGGWQGGRGGGGCEEEAEEGAIPWVLIPITGLSSERYTCRDRNIPQDPRFQHLATATTPTTQSPTPSPEPSPPPSPFLCPSPEPSPPPPASQCPSPDPSPPASPSQCPSPEPSPPLSPSQYPSPESSPTPSPSQCPAPTSSSHCPPPQLSHPPSVSQCRPLEPNKLSLVNKERGGVNEEQAAPAAPRESAGTSESREVRSYGMEGKNKPTSASTRPAPERITSATPPTKKGKEDAKEQTGEAKKRSDEKSETRPLGRKEEKSVDLKQKADSDKKQKGGANEPAGDSLCPLSVSSPPSAPLRHIDTIVDKHLDTLSAELQLILQGENIHFSFPQSPHSTSNTDASADQPARPHLPMSQFSQYVSPCHPSPAVQDYVSSLQDSIDCMLTELDDARPKTDAALATKVSAFLSSIRAAEAKTGTDEVPAADVGASSSQTASRVHKQAAHSSNPPASHVTLSVTTSASGSVNKQTNSAVHHRPPDTSPHSHWTPPPPQSHASEVTHNIRRSQDTGITRTVYCTAAGEGGLARTNCEVALPAFGGAAKPLTGTVLPSEPGPSLAPVSGPCVDLPPPTTGLSSIINQLQPEMFSNLVEIIKDIKRNSVQFYLHGTEPGDNKDIKEHLLKQGNVEQSPMTFLNKENADSRLLVIIKNINISRHVHKIPGLVSLKRHPNVVFVGIDTLDDIRNNSYNELFASGGCIVSDEFVLSPEFITPAQLTALLGMLEQYSSSESVWRLKVHYRTHKKLKEQSRFRMEAAPLLDILSAYQKRQIVEFLPYHHCDLMSAQSPDLGCLMDLQSRYTQYRHTIFLTEHHSERFPAHAIGGIIKASIEEVLHNFTRLVGYHDVMVNQAAEHMQTPKEQIQPHSSCNQRPVQQSTPAPPPLSHLSGQLVPNAASQENILGHSGKDYENLRLAISQLRAKRQAQMQQQEVQQQEVQLQQQEVQLQQQEVQLQQQEVQQQEVQLHHYQWSVSTSSHHASPLLDQGGQTESVQLIHSALQLELSREDVREVGAEGRRSGESPGRGAEPRAQRDGTPLGALGGKWASRNDDMSSPSSNQKTAAVTGTSHQSEVTNGGRENTDQKGEPVFPAAAELSAASRTAACPAEGATARNAHSGQEQPIGEGGASPGNSTVGTTGGPKVPGSTAVVAVQEDRPNPVFPQLHQVQPWFHQRQSRLQPAPLSLQHRTGLLPTPHLPPPHLLPHHLQPQHLPPHHLPPHHLQPPHPPQFQGHAFSHGPLLTPLPDLGGGILGPAGLWPQGWSPAGATTIIWGFQQSSVDINASGLLAAYHNPAGQGSNGYRGEHTGGDFNGRDELKKCQGDVPP